MTPGHHWRPVQTCSFEELPQPHSDIWWWLLKHVRSAQADSAHPTGRLSCFLVEVLKANTSIINYLEKTSDFTRNNGRDFFTVTDNVFVLRY